ncbi:MAG: PEP-CTERM sorting domain-containing protein [Candidatus Auribacterota bacterium]
MKSFMIYMFVICSFLFTVPPLKAAQVSDTDLWNYQNISSISSSVMASWSNVRDVFGAALSTVEAGRAMFTDTQPAGYQHWIQWTLNAPALVSNINLVAVHDLGGIEFRGMSRFILDAYVDSSWLTVVDYTVVPKEIGGKLVYGGGPYYTDTNRLELELSFGELTAQTWKAYFVQYGNTTSPRIMELDAFYTPEAVVPEPASLVLIAIGTAILLRKKR